MCPLLHFWMYFKFYFICLTIGRPPIKPLWILSHLLHICTVFSYCLLKLKKIACITFLYYVCKFLFTHKKKTLLSLHFLLLFISWTDSKYFLNSIMKRSLSWINVNFPSKNYKLTVCWTDCFCFHGIILHSWLQLNWIVGLVSTFFCVCLISYSLVLKYIYIIYLSWYPQILPNTLPSICWG